MLATMGDHNKTQVFQEKENVLGMIWNGISCVRNDNAIGADCRQYSTHLCRKLAVVKVSVEFAQLHQFIMVTLLNDSAVFHHQDMVGVPDGGKPVGDDKAGTAFHQGIHCLLDFKLRAGVYTGSCLIQN